MSIRTFFMTSILVMGLCGVVALRIAHASDGNLDPRFGIGGLVTTDFAGGSEEARAVVVQPDGKIIAAGFTGGPIDSGFALTRYTPKGDLDTSFGTNGKVVTVLPDEFIFANAIVLQPDEKIVVAGAVSVGGPFFGKDFLVARYTSDGSLDTTFGTGGLVITDFGADFSETARAISLQSNGKIVVVGGVSTEGFGIARYNLDGTLDSSFGTGGKVVTPLGPHPLDAHAVVIQPDHKIVVGGWVNRIGTGADFVLVRHNEDGTTDSGFGAGGIVTTDFPADSFVNSDVLHALVLQPDGKIVAVGSTVPQGFNPDRPNFALARYDSNGSLDTTFGVGGMVTTHLGGDDQANAAILQTNGAIVVSGFTGAFGYPTTAKDFALVRYRSDGALDLSFGVNGVMKTDFFGNEDEAKASFLHTGGQIVVAGTSSPPFTPNFDFALARYLVSVDFAEFSARLTIWRSQLGNRAFFARGRFDLGDDSDGIDPPTETVVVSFANSDGVFFEETVPPGSFQYSRHRGFLFYVTDGSFGLRKMIVKRTKHPRRFAYAILGTTALADADGNPVSISLQIGNDVGLLATSCRHKKKALLCR